MKSNESHPGYRLSVVPEARDTCSEGARQEWKNLAEKAFALQTVRPADLRAFEMACEILADINVLQETIRGEGITTEGGSGGRKSHPALASLARARTQAKELLDRFGLLPGSQAKPAPEYRPGGYNRYG